MFWEHTDSDHLCDRIVNGETTYREVNILQVTSRTIADLWLLFKLVWLQFYYPHRSECTHWNIYICSRSRMQTTSLPAWQTRALIPPSCSLAGGWKVCHACLAPRRMPTARPHTNRAAAKPHKEIVNESRGFCSASSHTHTHHVVYFIWLIPTYTLKTQYRQARSD